jgi:IS30 family transposase
MRRTYSQLYLNERRKIECWRHAGVTVDVIAEKLGRRRSTIFREIARNKLADTEMPELTVYFCVPANSKAKDRRSRYRKMVRHPKLRASIIESIKHGWWPEQIAGRLAYERSTEASWYNAELLHSGIGYVTPQKQRGSSTKT